MKGRQEAGNQDVIIHLPFGKYAKNSGPVPKRLRKTTV